MSLLPFLPGLFVALFAVANGRIGYRGAHQLMQIQRVLELSAEIARAEDVSITDASTAESRYSGKRESYSLPNDFFVLVNNNLQEQRTHQNSDENYGQVNYVTPAPDPNSNTLNHPNDEVSRYQEGQHVQYTISPETNQQYAVSQPQQFAIEPTQQQQYQVQQGRQYDGQVAQSYVAQSGSPSHNGIPRPQIVTAQEHIYTQPQSLQYEPVGPQHYTIAAHQAVSQQVPIHQTPQQMFFFGGHQQTGSHTEAVIHPTPSQYVAHMPVPSEDPSTARKVPVQINIHPQAYGLVTNYRIPHQEQYMPLQILINGLSEPTKYATGLIAVGGPEQPKMPIYHYSPVPAGTLKEEHSPEMRIKSSQGLPNPHSNTQKDYSTTSSSPSFSSLPTVVSSNAQTQGAGDYEDDEFIKYDFGYRVSDDEHKVEFGKTESKKDGVTRGSYHVLLPDGRLQVVKYWSDHTGYHTNITYSVPGVDVARLWDL